MSETSFKPTIYLRSGCPFCLKVTLFLLESGQLDGVTLREFVPGTAEEAEIRALLAPVVAKVTFPTAELAPGIYTTESDAIVAHFAGRASVKPESLPIYNSYLRGVYQNLQSLFRENLDLKKQIASG